MKITSSVFENNRMIPAKYTCDGENINPLLEISDAPDGAKSLALIVDDPDAPMGTFVHWVLYNINPGIDSIKTGSIPEGGKEAENSSGKKNYIGPCPPSGVHHYHFKLYALDIVSGAGVSSRKELEMAMEGHIIEQAELVGLYHKNGS